MKSVNPTNGELIAEYRETDDKGISDALDALHANFEKFRKTDVSERVTILRNMVRQLKNKRENYAGIITQEMGKAVKESLAEVDKCAWVCEHYADNAEGYLHPNFIESSASESFVRFDPIGTVLAVMPWNFPFWQLFRFLAPAIALGNTGVLKHASNVSACALAIEEIVRSAAGEWDIFRSLIISSRKVEAVIRHPKIAAVTLTGSEWAGSEVARIAGSEIKKSVLELGGSDPFIVLADADIEDAANTAVTARMLNAGQSCIAAKRFIVQESVYDDFLSIVRKKIAALKTDDPTLKTTDIGPLARIDLRNEIHSQVQRSVSQGAELLLGGEWSNDGSAFYTPALLHNVLPEMPIFSEESFGPAMPVCKVKDANEAIGIANASPFGLGASLWTRDIDRAKRLATGIDSGSVFINDMTKSDPRLPFGGVKKSGYGRELSQYGLKEFANIKTVFVK